ncbi:MAG: protoheme IX farnesyltransferase [Legionellales bacterium]|nr:protoheme IX farnesyltransferase [Legionellales bacterium]|tara:strand:+ start:4752 stop:5618 length:867 start_codon:yes stop_codon:yes gene_type:complete
MALLQEFLVLCKFRVVVLMLLSALVGMLLASDHINPFLIVNATLGIGCICAAGGVCNQLFDVGIDRKMLRTQNRPLLSQNIDAATAWIFVVALIFTGITILTLHVNVLTAILSVAGMVGYAWIYTCYLKYFTPQNIVIGGFNGALPPLLGWTAVTGQVSAEALALVLIIYTWTPPHFWALAISKKEEYAKADIPMLPVTHGVHFTCQQIILYTLLMVIATIIPILMWVSGVIYAIGVSYLNARFILMVYRLWQEPNSANAMRTFTYSISYLMYLFLLLLIDHFILIHI